MITPKDILAAFQSTGEYCHVGRFQKFDLNDSGKYYGSAYFRHFYSLTFFAGKFLVSARVDVYELQQRFYIYHMGCTPHDQVILFLENDKDEKEGDRRSPNIKLSPVAGANQVNYVVQGRVEQGFLQQLPYGYSTRKKDDYAQHLISSLYKVGCNQWSLESVGKMGPITSHQKMEWNREYKLNLASQDTSDAERRVNELPQVQKLNDFEWGES